MKHSIAIAVAGSIIINSLGVYKNDKKNDLFLKADSKYKKEHKCSASVKNTKCKSWRNCRAA